MILILIKFFFQYIILYKIFITTFVLINVLSQKLNNLIFDVIRKTINFLLLYI